MATTTTNFGWDIPQSTDLVKDGATAIATLGQDIDTAFVDLKGGTTGQVLAKASGTDLDFTWSNDAGIPATILDAKGDLIAATAADTAARLAVGTNGQVLTADSTASTGLKWASPAGGGKILQVIQSTYSTTVSTTSTSYQDTNLSVTITPSSTSSRIMVLAYINDCVKTNANSGTSLLFQLVKNGTQISYVSSGGGYTGSASYLVYPQSLGYVDSPASTSALTYKVQFASSVSGQEVRINSNAVMSTMIVMEVGA